MMMTDITRPLNVALLGSGLFATTSHAPVLKKNPDVFNCVAVYSRRQESASKLANILDTTAYTDIEEVLRIPNLDAVIMALPLDVQPTFVLQSLKAGKHVLSEKPIAATVEVGNNILKEYVEKYAKNDLIWSVAENFRYEPAINHAAEIIQKNQIGKPLLMTLNIQGPFTKDNKYLNTSWRKEPSWYGGLFIDAFVHASAQLRAILGNVKSVSAITTSNAEYIPDVDTMVGHVTFENGLKGSISVTYACTKMKNELTIIGTEGQLVLSRKIDGPGYRLSVSGNDGSGTEKDFDFGGLDGEFLAFAAACQKLGRDCNTPLEAVQDLAFVQACLESGKNNGAITRVKSDMMKAELQV